MSKFNQVDLLAGRSKSWRLGLSAIALLTMLVVPGVTRAADQTVIRIAGSAWVGDGPTKVAAELGLFNLGGIEPPIEVLNLGSGLEAVEMLMRGEVEFALGATTPVALALIGALGSEPAPSRQLVVLASLALSSQTHKLIVHQNAGIETPSQLRGHRVGIMRGTSSHYGWSLFAEYHGLIEDAVELVHLPVSEMAAALLDDRIDAALIWEPWDRILAEALNQRPLTFELRMLYTVNWLLLADRQFTQDNPELVDRVLIAYRDAISFMDAEPERALALHAQYSELDVEDLQRRRDGLLWRLGMNWSVLVNLGGQFEWLATWPELKGRRIPEPREYLLASPLARVAPESVTLPPYLLMDPAGLDATP